MKHNKNYYLEILNVIEKNLLGRKNSREGALKYFRLDSISFEICYKIMKNYYNDETTNFESLYKQMHSGSRQKVKTIIDHAVELKYLSISQNKLDTRKRDISPSKITIQEFESHLEELKQKLNSFWLFPPTPMRP